MDLRGEEGESCIATEESRCNRLTELLEKWGKGLFTGGEEEYRLGGEVREGDGGRRRNGSACYKRLPGGGRTGP